MARTHRRTRGGGQALDDRLEPPPGCDQVLRNHSVGSTCSGAASGAAIDDGDPHQQVVGRRLGVLDEHVEIAVVVEHAGVEQLVLGLVLRPRPRLVATRSL